ncbi:hypothetical protein ACIHBQ_15535 [Streptomyces sp. NPDC052492]|uniref:YqeB family protein n=1 Tax=unclassified Streptomyces TaxID=2593676 RepID=UPI0037CD5D3C
MDLDGKPDAPVRGETVLTQSPLLLTLVCVGCGAGLVPLLTKWMVTLRWAPFKSPTELLTSVPEPSLTLRATAMARCWGWLVVGFLAVRIGDARIVLTIRDASRQFRREDVASAHRDGKQLVLLASDGAELARETGDLSASSAKPSTP